MQTSQRKKDDNTDPTTAARREGRPLHFADASVPGSETGYYAPGMSWGPQGFRPPMTDEGGSNQPQAFGFSPYGGQTFATPSSFGFAPTWQQGFGRPGFEGSNPTNPFASVAPTLSYGLAGLTDLVYRGIALASTQGQALLNAVQNLQPMRAPQGRTEPAPVAWPMARLPATDIVDEGAELVCQIELPGVKTENVDVSCFARGILVTARSEPEIDIGALVQAERGLHATYRRGINLPVPVQPSGAKATLRDGVLTINLPKANPTEAPRRVPVS